MYDLLHSILRHIDPIHREKKIVQEKLHSLRNINAFGKSFTILRKQV
jgi:hypothetical protein